MTTTVAEPEVTTVVAPAPQTTFTEEEFAALEEQFKAELKCSVVHYSCFNCKFYTAKCDHPATILVVKSCGCRMPVCQEHADGYRHHFDTCIRKRVDISKMWRCGWCRKWCKPDGFRHEPIA